MVTAKSLAALCILVAPGYGLGSLPADLDCGVEAGRMSPSAEALDAGAEQQISMLQKTLQLSSDAGQGGNLSAVDALSPEKIPAEAWLLQVWKDAAAAILKVGSSRTDWEIQELIQDFEPIFLALLCLTLLALLTLTVGKLQAPVSVGDSEPHAGKLLNTGQASGVQDLRRAMEQSEQTIDRGPPIICSSLILPNTEARFMISLHSIRTANILEIRGTSGRKLLTGTFGISNNRKQFMLACIGCENDPRCVINEAGVERPCLQVLGRELLPFGELEPLDPLMADGAVLKCSGEAVMLIEVLRRSELQVKVTTPNNMLLATGGSGRAAGYDSREHADADPSLWQLQVKPGADAVLIISCILAMARHWNDLSCVVS